MSSLVPETYLNITQYGDTRWPWKLRRTHRKAIKVAAIPIDNLNESNINKAREISAKLTTFLNDVRSESWGDLAEIYQLQQYLDLLGEFPKRDRFETLCNVLPIMCGRFFNDDHYKKIHKDSILSNCFQIVGMEYLKAGEFDNAFDAFGYAWATAKQRLLVQRLTQLSAACAYLSKNPELIELVDDMIEDVIQYSAHLQSLYRCFHDRLAEKTSPQDLLGDICLLGQNDPLLALLAAERVIETLLKQHHTETAEQVVSALRKLFASCEPWVESLILQFEAQISFAKNDFASARDNANYALKLSEYLLLQPCLPTSRKSVFERYDKSRTIALKSYLELNDARGMAQFIEDHRLKVTVDASIEEVEEEPLAAPREPNSDAGNTTQNDDLFAPSLILDVWHEITTCYSMTSINQSAHDTDELLGLPLSLSYARVKSSIFWAAASNGIPLGCGELSLTQNRDLSEIINTFEQYFTKLHSDTDQFPEIDLFHYLREWGTPEETWITETLGTLIPDCVKNVIFGSETRTTLTISTDFQIPPLPWPIFRIAHTGVSSSLIESTDIHHWLSARLSSASRKHLHSESIPLLLVIDNPDGRLTTQPPPEFSVSQEIFSGPILQHGNSVWEYAVNSFVNHPAGVLYYRGHLESRRSPADAYFKFPTPIGTSESDESSFLAVGQLFGKFEDGKPWFPLPTRVILSCCSSSGTGQLAGEAIGLAAACIEGGGASEVIATSIDILDDPFTSRFDGMLTQVSVDSPPLYKGLSMLQNRVYLDWRNYSLRGGEPESTRTAWPHPLIWAMYQAY